MIHFFRKKTWRNRGILDCRVNVAKKIDGPLFLLPIVASGFGCLSGVVVVVVVVVGFLAINKLCVVTIWVYNSDLNQHVLVFV